jgi:hypothetical protein
MTMIEPQVFISDGLTAYQLGRLLYAIGTEFPDAAASVDGEGLSVTLPEEGQG